jgi:GYF domain 2
MEWVYVTEAGEQVSVIETELEGLVRAGAVRPTTLLWRTGDPDWHPAAEMKPELFSTSTASSAGLTVGRAVLEPLWRRRGWLVPFGLGLLGVGLLRAGFAAAAAWPDAVRLAGVLVSLGIIVVLVSLLARWWVALGRAARSGGLHEARIAMRAGGHVLIAAGLVGAGLLMLATYDLISLAAAAVLNR